MEIYRRIFVAMSIMRITYARMLCNLAICIILHFMIDKGEQLVIRCPIFKDYHMSNGWQVINDKTKVVRAGIC